MKFSNARAGVAGVFATAFLLSSASAAFAESIRDKTERAEGRIPQCSHRIGTAAIYEPENHWWQGLGLESPEALIKVFVMRSNCFTLLDRGKGFDVAQRERDLASSGELRQGSNMGKGQMKAADYVIVPDIASKNPHASQTNIGGIFGGMIGGPMGAAVAGISITKKTADVVLSVTDVRSSEELAAEEGHASKSDVGFGAGGAIWGAGGFGGLGIDSYANTEIGQVVTLAYIDAYSKLVEQLGGLSAGGTEAVSQAVSMTRAGRMYTTSSIKSKVVRKLDAGMMLYPTGDKDGAMWEVKDELGNQGWVSSMSFELAK